VRPHDQDRPGGPTGPARPSLTAREIVSLVLAAYKTSLPYFVLIVLVLVIVTWLATEVLFTR
jgi:hypothetical protein